MTAPLAALQPVLLAVVLVASARGKLVGRAGRRAAAGTALGRLLGASLTPVAYAALGVLELAVAAALLAGGLPAPGLRVSAAAAAAALTAGFLGYLGYARLWAPGSSCGCLGARQSPVTWRSFARAGLLLLAALAALAAPAWPAAWRHHPVPATLVLLAELAAVATLSAELDHAWLLPWRRLRLRLRPHPLAGAAHDVPLANTVQQLLRSPAYRGVGSRLRSDVQDSWDEGDWRIVCYRATGDAGPATAVFAVPRLRYDPDAVRVALVDEAPRQDPAPAPA